MKNILLGFTFFMLGCSLFAQPDWDHIEIKYDQTTNILSVQYDVCRDPCTGTSDEYCDRKDCIATCTKNFQNGTIIGIAALANCIEGCGEYVPPNTIRVPVVYSYNVIATWENIPFDPINNHNHWAIFPGGGAPNANGEIIIPNVTLPEPWPEIHTGHNTCYGIMIQILYDDGYICNFIEWNCNIIG